MPLLSKHDLLSDKVTVTQLEIPELGGSILVKEWTGEDMSEFESFAAIGQDGKPLSKRERAERARLSYGFAAYLSIVDENGQRLFDKSDVEALAKRGMPLLGRIWSKVRHYMNPEIVETMEGN